MFEGIWAGTYPAYKIASTTEYCNAANTGKDIFFVNNIGE